MRTDLANFAQNILSWSKHPKKEETKKDTYLALKHYIVQNPEQGKFLDLFMEAVIFPSGKGNGLQTHLNFGFEKYLGGLF